MLHAYVLMAFYLNLTIAKRAKARAKYSYKVKLAMVGETIRLKMIKSIEEYQSNLELKILCLDHRLTDVGKVYSNIS